MDCPFCFFPISTRTKRCRLCGATKQEIQNGTRGASSPARGGADPSSGVSPGTVIAKSSARAPQSFPIAEFARAWAAAIKAAGPGLMGATGFASFGGPGLVSPRFGALTYVSAADLTNPHPPLETAPMSVGEFVGWRVWRVRPQDRLLQSYSQDRIWLPGEPMQGEPRDHGPEGVWAFKDADRAAQKVCGIYDSVGPAGALGSVWLWGNVVEHADGYRAEFATVRSIDGVTSDPGDDALMDALRQRYGVGSAEDADKL